MTGHVTTGTILDKIIDRTRADVAIRKSASPLTEVSRRAARQSAPVDFFAALSAPGVGVIAEVKRGSPSRGRFPIEVDAADVARSYVAGGAAAISVLTDAPFFHGGLGDLETVAAVAHAASTPVPVLRKDFVVDPYQVAEARAFGADALLLIVAALDDAALASLLAETRALGMEALVEVHDESEMARAASVGARVIGINNRDLRDFRVDLATTERLAPLAPSGAIVVGESGVFTRDDVRRLQRAGAKAVLVGEGIIVRDDRPAAVRELTIRPGDEDDAVAGTGLQ